MNDQDSYLRRCLENLKKSWALMGVRSDEEFIIYLEIHMLESSQDVLDVAEGNLVDDTP